MLIEQRADVLFKGLLRDVPMDIREEVQNKALKEAEEIAKFKEMSTIEKEAIIAGLITAVPNYFRASLRKILDYHGVDPSPFESYFNSSLP